jgi:hypothetical protein
MFLCRGGTNQSNFRTAAYEAITAYITQATPDVTGVVQESAVAILSRMEHLLSIQNQILGVDDRNNWNELQSNFCSVIIVSSASLRLISLPSSHLLLYYSLSFANLAWAFNHLPTV